MFHGEIRKRLFRKNYFKLLLLGLLTPLLCGVSFAFNPLEYLNNTPYNVRNSVGSLTYNIQSGKTYCVYFTDPSDEWGSVYISSQRQTAYSCNSTYFMSNNNTIGLVCFQACSNVSNFNFLYQTYNKSTVSYSLYEFDTPISIGGGCSVPGQSCYDDDEISDLIHYVDSLSGDLATCQNSLSQCQASNCDTQLSQCIIDRDNYSSSVTTLSGSLASCNEDKTSLQNYNNSLSSQLNECLLGSGGGYTGGLSCLDYSLFWQDSDTSYSLPITNNLFLPNGYKGKFEDNVLSIAKINSLEAAYQFSEEDKVTIIDILSIVMLFLLATGSLIGLIVFLKRLVINRK